MRQLMGGVVFALACFATMATAADRPVVGPVPDWVLPAAAEIPPGAATNAALQVLLSDQQLRFSPTATEAYVDSRMRIQTPQGLQAIGTIALSWLPDADVITLHRLIVRRGTQVRDLLGNGDGFTVLRREDMLEQATLTGMLTAIMQPPDLQVGDIVEFSYTRRHADPVVPDKPDMHSGWSNSPIQNIHFRAQWPKQMALRWQLRDFKPELKESTSGDSQIIDFTLQNPPPLLQPTGAPARYAALRRVELTTFQSWPEVSKRLAPLYAEAAKLTKDSPLRAEIARIRAASADPKMRAAAALQLVEDQVRYVLLAMNEGALVPATAEQTWQRRYGDCKAKTALLLALLRELGIDAEPVVVNTAAGDGLDQLLPGISVFDHVLVRAQIGGETFWLDGTRLGDRQLDQLQVPAFHWGLPLSARGSELVRIQQPPLSEPQVVQEISLDASAGVDTPAIFQGKTTFHGADVVSLKMMLDNTDTTQRDQGLRSYWRKQYDGLQPTRVASTFDEATSTMTWTAEGTLLLDWSNDGFYEVDNMRLSYKPDLTRPEGTNAEAPYAVGFPDYSVFRTSIRLPPGKAGFTLSGDNINSDIAGRQYRRTAQMSDAVFTAEASIHSMVPEISAQQAHDAEAGLREIYKNGLYIRKPQQTSAAAPLPSAEELQSQAGKPLATAAEYVLRGQQMESRKLYQLAVGDFTHAIEMDPKSSRAYLNRGWSLEQLARLEEALADYRKAHELDPGDLDAARYPVAIYFRQGRSREAVDVLTETLQRNDNTTLRGMRASAYLSLREYEAALRDFEAISKADPNNAANYGLRVGTLMQMNRREAVDGVVAEVLAARVGTADGVSIAASTYELIGEHGKALALIDGAIAKKPTAELFSLRSTFTTNPEEISADLARALQLDPKFPQALLRMATLQLTQKKYPDALLSLDKLDAVVPATVESHRRRGEALAMLGNIAASKAAFSSARALAISASDFNSLCWSEGTTSEASLDDALKDCDASLAKVPDSPLTLDSRGFVLLKLRRYEEAIAAYDAALSRDPRQAASLYGRGIAKLRLGRKVEGEVDIKAAHDAGPTVETRFADYGVER